MEQLNITVNGKDYELQIKPSATLLDVIREDLGLTGTKEGCGVGECGACTVIMDGRTVNACLMLAVEAQKITSYDHRGACRRREAPPHTAGIRGYWRPPVRVLHPRHDPLRPRPSSTETESPTDEEIRKGLEGNFCRCTGYTKIIESVRAAANS